MIVEIGFRRCLRPLPAQRAYAGTDGRSWLALDDGGRPVEERALVRQAASIAALCEVAEETSGGGDLEELRAELRRLRVTESPPGIDEAEEAALALEQTLGLDRSTTLTEFSRRIDLLKEEFCGLVADLKAGGRSFAGYGAPAKATTLMYHFGIGPEIVEFVVDDSPWKQHLFTPGLHIPVLPAGELYRRRPDEVIVLAWNFASSIMAAHDRFRDMGGHFIVPLPVLRRV